MTFVERQWERPSPEGEEVRSDARGVAASTAAFGSALYNELSAVHKNLIFSPASIATVLAMGYAGARGVTAEEMATAMSLPALSADRLHAAFAILALMANTAPGVKLHTANAIFGQRGAHWLPEYLALLETRYHAPLHEVDFAADPVRAAAAINKWVSVMTLGLIPRLVSADDLGPLMRLALGNAVYFKGKWDAPFKRQLTSAEAFHLLDGSSKAVPLMHQEDKFLLIEDTDAQLLSLRYEDSPISMIVVLPLARDGLPAIEAALPRSLSGWLARVERAGTRTVRVYLPRFKIASMLSLPEALQRLGIRLAFDQDRADMSGMNGNSSDLYFDQAVHAAVIEVDEEGTTAAAAMLSRFTREFRVPAPPPTFRADHPFLFMLLDSRTSNILFLGRVLDPSV